MDAAFAWLRTARSVTLTPFAGQGSECSPEFGLTEGMKGFTDHFVQKRSVDFMSLTRLFIVRWMVYSTMP